MARDPFFEQIVIDIEDLAATVYTPLAPLESGRCHWWWVQAENMCGASAWSEARHFCTADLETVYYDDMESGGADWSHEAASGIDGWNLASGEGHTPDYAWHVPDRGSLTDSWLANTEPFIVAGGTILTFWHRYHFEDYGWDGAVLEVSVDGGPWADLGGQLTLGSYNGRVKSGMGNPLSDRAAWTGDLDAWTEVEVDLAPFAGQEVRVRWRLGCDGSGGDEGWYVDDVRLSVPGPAHPVPLVTAIAPRYGTAGVETAIEIQGSGFVETPLVWLGDARLLAVTQVSSTTLQALVPAGLEAGSYDLYLVNGDCQEAALPAAFLSHAGPCEALELAVVDGPAEGVTGTPYTFTAQASPAAATLPLSFIWQVAGRPPEVHTVAGLEDSLVVSWTVASTQIVSVTVENACSLVAADHSITVEAPVRPLYLPLVTRRGP